ncbi:MAG TPA: sugar phosphate isomerase/epimerase family protein [Thermomicrobiales bacterium]|nr:sugar phosphate isomerase/epimerase family protein [Thermomicrobiales bacterium]
MTYRLGVDARKYPGATGLGPLGVIEDAAGHGFEGVFFRTILDVSPTLAPDVLADVRRAADRHGMYIEVGLGKVNPFNTAEAPEIRAIGDGDYLRGMARMIQASREIGCTELWADTANYQRWEWGIHANDRFRTDVTWEDQLAATQSFLTRLAPVLRDAGCRVNLETHEEITTHELVRLVEAVGPDVAGITLDLANIVIRGENPMDAARRTAPFVHQTHIRDVVLTFQPYGLDRDIRACGDGIIDWTDVLHSLREHQPELNLSVETVSGPGRNRIEIFDPAWQDAHPDLDVRELMDLVRMAHETDQRIARGEIPGRDDYYPPDGLDAEGQIAFVHRCHAHLRDVMAALELAEADREEMRVS